MIIKPKRTKTSGKLPGTDDLVEGEIAMNIAKDSEGFFVKNSEGSIIKLGGVDLYTRMTSAEDTLKSISGISFEEIGDTEDISTTKSES